MLDINTVNPIGIGTFLMGGGFHREIKRDFADYSKDDEVIAAIRHSISLGQNHIDTACSYSDGHGEELVGQAVKDIPRDKIFIADKLSKGHMLRNAVVPCVKKMLARLGLSYLDLLYAHTANVPESMDEYILGMNDAVDAGLTRFIAVSNFDEQQLKHAMSISKHPIVANQTQLNLVDRERAPESLLSFCKQNNVKVVAYQPLRNQVFFEKYDSEGLRKIANKYNRTVEQIALNWLVNEKGVLVIPKAIQKKHIEDNIKSLEFKLSEEDVKFLDGYDKTFIKAKRPS